MKSFDSAHTPMLIHGKKTSLLLDPMSFKGSFPTKKLRIVPLQPPMIIRKRKFYWGLELMVPRVSFSNPTQMNGHCSIDVKGTSYFSFPFYSLWIKNREEAEQIVKQHAGHFLAFGFASFQKAFPKSFEGQPSETAIKLREKAWKKTSLVKLGPGVYNEVATPGYTGTVKLGKSGEFDWRFVLSQFYDVIQRLEGTRQYTRLTNQYLFLKNICEKKGISPPASAAFQKALRRIKSQKIVK